MAHRCACGYGLNSPNYGKAATLTTSLNTLTTMVKIPTAKACMAKSGTKPCKLQGDVLAATTKFLSDNTVVDLEQASQDGQRIDKELVNKLKWVLKKRVFYKNYGLLASSPLLSVAFMVDISIKFHEHELALSEVS
jgi:hypothetical protein